MEYLKTGVIFNLQKIKKEDQSLWKKYRMYFDGIKIENEEEVYMNYLVDKIDGKVLFNFLTECLPEEMRLPQKG